jgi:hypothetical protein
MKKAILILSSAFFCLSAAAQSYYQDAKNSEMLHHAERHEPCRREIILPQVNGYNVYKADLHTHTVFSDGQVLPKFRVAETWMDGIDIMAVTEHVEYRPNEEVFVDYLQKYADKNYEKAVNSRVGTDGPDKNGIMVDLNYCVRLSQKVAAAYGLLIIPGTEITRNGTNVGHFNALFTTDNNLIYDKDPVQAIRNAKAQGALVMHNHPGWRKESLGFTEAEKTAYTEGLIDGVEVMNGAEFYPGIVDRCRERGLFIAACSDIHGTTHNDYGYSGYLRPMTLILAKDNSLESLKEALAADRTIALGFNTVCGTEELLESFVKASVTATKVPDSNNIMLTNNTSVPFLVQQGDANPFYLDPFSTVRVSGKNCKDNVKLKVLNAFVSENEHLEVKISF